MNRLFGIALVMVATMAQARGPAGAVAARLTSTSLMPTVVTEVLPKVAPEGAVSGEIDIEVVVATTGAVTHARVANSTPGRAQLEQSALDAARGWKFNPALDRFAGPVTALAMIRMTIAPQSSGAPAVRAALMPVPRVAASPREGAPLPTVMYTQGYPGLRVPVVVREIRPVYTEAAMRGRVMGSVTLSATVLADGTVRSAMVIKPLHPELDQEALQAARYWIFEPAMLKGQPVPCVVTLVLEFRLH